VIYNNDIEEVEEVYENNMNDNQSVKLNGSTYILNDYEDEFVEGNTANRIGDGSESIMKNITESKIEIYMIKESKISEMNNSLKDIIENDEPEVNKTSKNFSTSIRDIVEVDDDSSRSLNKSTNDDVKLFEDDDRIYRSVMDIDSFPKDIVDDVTNFVSELIFLSELGQKHMFNFLIDIAENKERLDRNKKMLGKFCYREFFVLWLSPSNAQKLLAEKNNANKFLLRTSTTLAGHYTFSFRKGDTINHMRIRGSEVSSKLSDFKKKYKSLKVNPIYMKTSGYHHVGYVSTIEKPISLSFNPRRTKIDDDPL